MWTRLGVVLVAGALIGGCNKRSDSAIDTAKPSSSAAVVPETAESRSAAPVARDTTSPCPHTGQWAACNVEKRLKQSGFVVKRVGGQAPKRAGFSVTPRAYTLGSSRLEVFIYDSEADLLRDMAKLDTVAVVPAGVAGTWESAPLLIRSGNLAAVLLARNQRQAERVMNALTAGAPQPGSPR
ncbi:MAG: hypothetical protein ABI681_02560 [Gemmatimonadales bacterium]